MKNVKPFYECSFLLHITFQDNILCNLSNTIKNPKTEPYVQLYMNLYDIFPL